MNKANGRKKYLLWLILISLLMIILSACGKGKKYAAEYAELLQSAAQIDSSYNMISIQTSDLAKYIVTLYENQDAILPGIDKTKYTLAANGVFYKPKDDGKSAVFVSGFVPVDQQLKNVVYFTEPMDSMLIKTIVSNKDVIQVYYNDRSSYNRIYPFFDVLIQYEPKMDIPSFNFYYLADAKHNPKRESLWIKEPYVDPAGRGWMISCIAPVYYKNNLEGVAGLDVTINGITDKYLSEKNKNYLLVTDAGSILTANDYLITLLSLPPLKDFRYMETVKGDKQMQDDYNLLTHRDSDIRMIGDKIFKENLTDFDYKLGSTKLRFQVTTLKSLGWKLIRVLQ
jgi:hypothetical protein